MAVAATQEAKRLMEVNYLGAYMVTQSFLPVLIKEVSEPATQWWQ